MNIKIRNNEYKIVKDFGETVRDLELEEIVTDYYDNFDYIVGDWAYGKVRLKGFNKHGSKYTKSYNDYDKVDDYIANKCAYGCKYFILEKVKRDVEKNN